MRIVGLALAAFGLVACEEPLHTTTASVPENVPAVSAGLVGSYGQPLGDGQSLYVRILPEEHGLHFVEWYALAGEEDGFSALSFPTRMAAVDNGDGWLFVELRQGKHYYPLMLRRSAEGLLPRGMEMDRTKQIAAAKGLGLSLSTIGTLQADDRAEVAALLEALDDGSRDSLPAVSEAEFLAAVAPARQRALFDLDGDWRLFEADGGEVPDASALQALAEAGDAWAIYAVSRLHSSGMVLAHDVDQARLLARRALDAGEERAAAVLAQIDWALARSPEERLAAQKLFARAVVAGEPEAVRLFGLQLVKEEGASDNALKMLRRAADAGDPLANQWLGMRHFNGEGLPQDDALALKHFMLGARGALPEAAHNAGAMTLQGRGTEADPKAAAELFRLAARLDFGPSQARLGDLYWLGIGVTEDAATAVVWYGRAAEHGEVSAMRQLANAYYIGRGAAQDNARAARWFASAASAGDAYSAMQYATILSAGLGVEADCAAGRRWFQRALDGGHTEGRGSFEQTLAENQPGGRFSCESPARCLGEDIAWQQRRR